MPGYSVIIVTYNSERYIHKNLSALKVQTTAPDRVILVDSGSKDVEYLSRYASQPNVVTVLNQADIGFCLGNNKAIPYVPTSSEYILFLNPDAFLTPNFCQEAIELMEDLQNQEVGALSGYLLGYDIDSDTPTGFYDSTGIFRTWYGHWFDRHKGERVQQCLSKQPEEVPALCGALMFCRRQALEEAAVRPQEIWDNSFCMYKDDIDLSLRLRGKGWKLLIDPSLTAYHCRGWKTNRRAMPRALRLMSARNEIKVNSRYCWLGLPYSIAKYGAVKALDW